MERKEFLKLLGMSAGSVLIASCIQSCKKPSTKVDFTLDLTASANSALANNGGFVYSNGIIIAITTGGNFIAVAEACTHAGVAVTYDSANDRFHCSAHGSNFTDSGTVINGPAASPLKQYQTSLSGNSLRIFE